MIGGVTPWNKWRRKIVNAVPMDAYRGDEFSPGPSVQRDEEILAWIRNNSQTAYHPIGTCRMGPGPNAVVDDKLKVHGLDGLRVADASIFPTMPSGNTNAPSIMVGEKAADILSQNIHLVVVDLAFERGAQTVDLRQEVTPYGGCESVRQRQRVRQPGPVDEREHALMVEGVVLEPVGGHEQLGQHVLRVEALRREFFFGFDLGFVGGPVDIAGIVLGKRVGKFDGVEHGVVDRDGATCVVHQYVQSAPPFDGGSDDIMRCRAIGYVGLDVYGIVKFRCDTFALRD